MFLSFSVHMYLLRIVAFLYCSFRKLLVCPLYRVLNVLSVSRIKEACPVNQKCQTSSLIYQATVTRHDNNKEQLSHKRSVPSKPEMPNIKPNLPSHSALVTRHDNNKEESYIGLTDNTFKTRYNGHTSSFRKEQYRNATTLSNYIWTLKDKNMNYSLKWKIIDRGRAYQARREKLWPLWLRKVLHNIKTRTSKPKSEKWTRYLLQTSKKHLLCNK